MTSPIIVPEFYISQEDSHFFTDPSQRPEASAFPIRAIDLHRSEGASAEGPSFWGLRPRLLPGRAGRLWCRCGAKWGENWI